MSIYKPSELHEFLREQGIKPRKNLSQNFLVDGNIIRKIVQESHVEPDDLVLEIGPGPGSLTEALLDAKAKVIAVEKDYTLASALERLRNPGNFLEIFPEDIMTFPIEETVKKNLPKDKKAKVIANLPYHLTTPIITQLVTMHDTFSHVIVMVQDEVARRFTTCPGSREYGSITVFLNFHSKPHYAFKVKRSCFYPSPKVDSAIVVFELTPPRSVSDLEQFFIMTRTAFSQRRKMLRSALRKLYDTEHTAEALVKIGKNPQARPETLSVDEWISLFEELVGNKSAQQ